MEQVAADLGDGDWRLPECLLSYGEWWREIVVKVTSYMSYDYIQTFSWTK